MEKTRYDAEAQRIVSLPEFQDAYAKIQQGIEELRKIVVPPGSKISFNCGKVEVF